MTMRQLGVAAALTLAALIALAQGPGQQGGGQSGGQPGGQTGGQTGLNGAGQPQGQPGTQAQPGRQPADQGGKEGAKDGAKEGQKEGEDSQPTIFGDDYFAQARAVIAAQRRRQAEAPAPTPDQTAASPISANIRIPTPQSYVLGRGDRLKLRYWSSVRPSQEVDLVLDERGAVTLPESTAPISLVGQTVTSAEAILRRQFPQIIRGVQFTLNLSELRTISVTVLGESFAPGSYDVPASTTLFSLVYATGGPSERGSLRRISLKRQRQNAVNVDFYRYLVEGNTAGDQVLRDGDIIFFSPAQARVIIRGEVNRPGVYEALSGEKAARILVYAGGIKATGVAQRVTVQTVEKGVQRRIVDVDLTAGDEGPEVFSGDIIEVRAVRDELANVVTIEGAVDLPGRYAHSKGMKVADLLRKSRGALPKAFTRALLYRTREDGTQELLRIDLAGALENRPADNVELQPNDRLVVSTLDEINWTGGRTVKVTGAIRRPDTYTRADGMRVSDLVILAGGPIGDSFLDLAFLQRRAKDGSPGPLVRVDLRKAAMGDPQHDVLLEDMDELRILTFAEAAFQATKAVTVEGAVVAPGTYVRGEGMTIKDLLEQAGKPTPAAALTSGFLQRLNADGSPGRLEKVDLARALENDPAHNLKLGDGDKLIVYTKDEAVYSSQRMVRIEGAVQRPGEYPASENLTLQDLIKLAGGPLPNAGPTVEIASRYQQAGTEPRRVSLQAVLSGSTDSNPVMRPGDAATLNVDSSIITKVQLVTLQGAVMNPGVYALTGDPKKDTLANLVRRAGGPAKQSFVRGTQILRNPELLTTGIQNAILPRTWSLFQELSKGEYERAVARIGFERVKGMFGNLTNINVPPTAPQATTPPVRPADPDKADPGKVDPDKKDPGKADPGKPEPPTGADKAAADKEDADKPKLPEGMVAPVPDQDKRQPRTLDEAIAASLSSPAVTPARPLTGKELIPLGNIAINAEAALRRPGGASDVQLKDGDVITIPEPPTTVSLTGAVVLPATVAYQQGRPILWYLQRAGGLTADANREVVLVIRASGELVPARRTTRIEPGDVIFVPTSIQAIKISQYRETLRDVSQFSQSALTSIALIRALIR